MDHYDLQKTAVAVATASVIYVLCRRYSRPSIKDIPGPPNPSWVYGRLEHLLVPLFVPLIAIMKGMNGVGINRMSASLKNTS